MSTVKLNQILAVEKSVKKVSNDELTARYHLIQKAPLLSGISRTYKPKDEEGDQLPPESTLVQVNVEDVLKEVSTFWTDLFDVTATKDYGNTTVFADVKIGDNVLVSQAPVTFLLWLEKNLIDIHTVLSKLPTLDPAEEWEYDANAGAYRTPETQTTRTKKVPKNWVKAEATDKHPAQVEIFHEDVLVGYWTTVKFSGALPADRKTSILRRVEELQKAVKMAREEANSVEVEQKKVGDNIFAFLLS